MGKRERVLEREQNTFTFFSLNNVTFAFSLHSCIFGTLILSFLFTCKVLSPVLSKSPDFIPVSGSGFFPLRIKLQDRKREENRDKERERNREREKERKNVCHYFVSESKQQLWNKIFAEKEISRIEKVERNDSEKNELSRATSVWKMCNKRQKSVTFFARKIVQKWERRKKKKGERERKEKKEEGRKREEGRKKRQKKYERRELMKIK